MEPGSQTLSDRGPGMTSPRDVRTPSPAPTVSWEEVTAQLHPALIFWGIREFGFSREECEDALQTAFLRALRHQDRVREPVAYVRMAYVNVLRDMVRARVRARGDSVEVQLEEADSLSDLSVGVDTERLDTLRVVTGALGRVGEKCRKLIEEHCLDERTLPEVAATLGYSGKTIWKRFQKCLKRMRQCLG